MAKPLLHLVLFLVCLTSVTANAQPRVTATIKPLQLIAAAVTHDVSEPALLLRSGADPHHYALRPSERAALEQADIVLWIGPALEHFLSRLIPDLESEVITALDLPGLRILPLAAAPDPHVWLDSRNARLIAAELARQLVALDPDNAATYQRNLKNFEAVLEQVGADIDQSLKDIAEPASYAVYHNAFQYFEARHGLQHVTSFVDNEELKPGIRHLLNLKRELQDRQVRCILVEPSVNTDELQNVLEDEGMRYEKVDVLGYAIAPSEHAYAELLRGVADAMLRCLNP